MWRWLQRWLGGKQKPVLGVTSDPEPVEPVVPPPPTLELIAAPGAGKTSFLWASTYMMRRLSMVWPRYVCWPQDDDSEKTFGALHLAMERQELPAAGAPGSTLYLLLREMERWGTRHFCAHDHSDAVFGTRDAGTPAPRPLNWGSPVCWLLNLTDVLDRESHFDRQLDALVRARMRSARALDGDPLRLIVALNKADRLADLPRELRDYLKGDPLAPLVSRREGSAHAEDGGRRREFTFDAGGVAAYLRELAVVHERIAAWLGTTLSGRLLTRRADAHHVTLRFSILSATGADLQVGGKLAIPWQPRRVLDPLFWALELGMR